MRRTAIWLVLVALALRLPGLWTDFWLDEIWALGNVGALGSPVGVFTDIHHDSNHWLISLWMYAVGQESGFWVYRLPSLVAGVFTVAVAGLLARSERTDPTLAMLLVAVSFPLGFYASEARGYGVAACAALGTWLALTRWLRTADWRWLAAENGLAMLGVLAHLSFVAVMAAEALFLVALIVRGRELRVSRLLLPFVAPASVLALLAAVDLRYLQFGGGPPLDLGTLLVHVGAFILGGPVESRVGPIVALAGAAAVGLALGGWIRRARNPAPEDRVHALAWVFYAGVIVLPVLAAIATRPPFLFARYFLVGLVFVPVLLTSLLVNLSMPARSLAVGVVVLLNGWSWAGFAAVGRGQYELALSDIGRAAAGPATVTGDHEFRVRTVVEFYVRRSREVAAIAYVPSDGQFVIATDRDGHAPPPSCPDCELLGSYPSSPLSGTAWRVYERRGLK